MLHEKKNVVMPQEKRKPQSLTTLSLTPKNPILPIPSSFSFISVYSISMNSSMDIILALVKRSLFHFIL
jgi:hypothetical protein